MALLRALRSTVFLGGAYLLLRSASGEGTAGSLAVAAVLGIALLYLVGSFLDGAEFTPEVFCPSDPIAKGICGCPRALGLRPPPVRL